MTDKQREINRLKAEIMGYRSKIECCLRSLKTLEKQ